MKPAADLAVKMQVSKTECQVEMQVSKTEYQVEMQDGEVGNWKALSKGYLQEFPWVDVRTRRPIKATSRAVADREGVLGRVIMQIEPAIARVSMDTFKDLRPDTFLAALDLESKSNH